MGVMDDRPSNPAWRSEGFPEVEGVQLAFEGCWIFLDGQKKRGHSREARCVWQGREWNARS